MSNRPGLLTRIGIAYYGARREAALRNFQRWFADEWKRPNNFAYEGRRLMGLALVCIEVWDRVHGGATRQKVASLPPDHQDLFAMERLDWVRRRAGFPEDMWLRFLAAETYAEREAIDREYEMLRWGNTNESDRNPWDSIGNDRRQGDEN